MKRFWAAFLFVLCVHPNLFASEIIIGQAQAKHFNDVYKKMTYFDFDARYDTEDKQVGIFLSHSFQPCAIWFDQEQRGKLATIIQKYTEWDKQATTKGVGEMEKEIGSFMMRPYFKYGDTWHRSGDDMKASVTFFTRSVGKNELVFSFDEWASSTNEYITHKEDSVYFEKEEILMIADWITDASVQKAVAKQREKEKTAEEFK